MNQEFTDYYESNLKLLEKNHPSIWKHIIEDKPEALGEISHAPNGNPNLIVTDRQGNCIVLHDETNPKKEGRDFLKKVIPDHKGFIAILGMGLCYSALNILKERPQLQYLAIFELETGIFIQALHCTDLSPILKDPRLILGIGANSRVHEVLAPADRTLQLETSNLFYHQPSFNFNPKGYNQLNDDLFAHINGLNIGGTTTRILGKDFLTNRFKHVSTIHHNLLLEQIQNKFDGVPAILVAGGPSLDKNIHLVKQVQEKALIIAVDTALPALLKSGVHPHFLTCIDPNNLTYEKFADFVPQAKEIALICSSWVNPKTPKFFPADQIFWTFTSKPIEAWINTLLGGRLMTGGASTVAHLNLISAEILGCDPIIFIGQDLAYPGTASHAKNTILHGSAPLDIVTSNKEETVKGIDGKTIRTNRAFLSMKKHFEAAIAVSSRTYINSTEGGAHIEGTKILPLQETIDLYCKEPINATQRLKVYYENIKSANPEKLLFAFDGMLNKIKQIQRQIKKSDSLMESLLKELSRLKKARVPIKSIEMLSKPYQEKVTKIDHFHKTLDETIDVWKILEEITMDGLKESERQKQDISILKNDPDKYIEWLIKNLRRLLGINGIRKSTSTLLAANLNMVISFRRNEINYKRQIATGVKKAEYCLKLARLYMESQNYYLAKPLVEELCQTMPGSGELFFLRGCIALQFNEHSNAKKYFETAMTYNPEMSRSIESYQKSLGDEFFSFAQHFKTLPNREASIRYMLIKGLEYCPDHNDLKRELTSLLKQDLQIIKSHLKNQQHENAASLVTRWHKIMTEHEDLKKSLSVELVKQVFLNYGKLNLSKKNYPEALESFNKALAFLPHDHELLFIAIDTCFIAKDYSRGIELLNHAIKVDREFAAYWETLGDQLQAENQNEEAIVAYEKCFIHLPEKINLLKKIGDCYMDTGELEAAKAAYEQLKLRMQDT